MSEKTYDGTPKVPYEIYQKMEREVCYLVDMLVELGIRTNEKPKQKAINIRWLQQALADELSKGNFTADAFKTVNEVIGKWKKSEWKM